MEKVLNKSMEVIILAGGKGSRLQSVVSDVPKPMALVNGKPFLEYIFYYLKKNNIKKVILSVGYKFEIIKKYFGDRFLEIDIDYSIENEPLGTGGAIKKALEMTQGSDVYVLNGDTFFDIDLAVLKKKFEKHNSKLLLSLKKMFNFERYGCVNTDFNGSVIGFTEKEYHDSGEVNGGVYLINRHLFKGYTLLQNFSFEKFMMDNYKPLCAKSVIFDDYFIDIGIPEDYEKAQEDFNE